MSRVVGIGGIFIKAKDSTALRHWYSKHLGMDIDDWGGMIFNWNGPDTDGENVSTTWSIFDESSTYFSPSDRPFMVNYIVKDLHRVLADLRSEGCAVDEKTEASEYGNFGWVMDPEGNRIELWEPPKKAAK